MADRDTKPVVGEKYTCDRACANGHFPTLRYVRNKACVACVAAAKRVRYLKNREKEIAAVKAWTEANKEKVSARVKAYRQANKEELKVRSKAYREALALRDPVVVAAAKAAAAARSRAWHSANQDRKRIRSKTYRSLNKEAKSAFDKAWRVANREACRAYRNAYRARKQGSEGRYSAADVRDLAVKQKNKCAYCRTCIKAGYHVDHIMPLSKGGSSWPSNLQLLCRSCNTSKGAKHPVEFAQQMGKLI